ncbi:MurR/RpiR family transcriptional regulator [Enterococcus sp. AZ126]|uniref:MurR/RpiR family transcriptional regulator n=1 Tax=Enterococcus sp. AZ126 TaxID=2774635 RepID=UPI003F248C95
MLEKISDIKHLSDADEIIQNYIFRNLETIVTYSARKLALQIPCSPSTITRFIKKCGFSSYYDFQNYMKNEINQLAGKGISDTISLEQIFVNQVFADDIDEQIEIASNLLNQANFIYCVGMGSSGIMASYAARKLNTIGLKSMHSNEPYAPFFSDSKRQNDSICLIFSSSGETAEIIKTVQLLTSNNQKIISVTNTHNNTLAKLSTLNIPYYIENRRLPYNFDLSSQLPTVALIEYLVAFLLKKQERI